MPRGIDNSAPKSRHEEFSPVTVARGQSASTLNPAKCGSAADRQRLILKALDVSGDPIRWLRICEITIQERENGWPSLPKDEKRITGNQVCGISDSRGRRLCPCQCRHRSTKKAPSISDSMLSVRVHPERPLVGDRHRDLSAQRGAIKIIHGLVGCSHTPQRRGHRCHGVRICLGAHRRHHLRGKSTGLDLGVDLLL